MTRIQTLLFDVGGVLHFSTDAYIRDINDSVPFNTEQAKAFWSRDFPRYEAGQVTEAELWEQVAAIYGVRSVGLDENLFGRSYRDGLTMNYPLRPYVAELRERGFQTAVLSNTNERHERIRRQTDEYDGFEPIYLSQEIGYSKPDAEAYRYALADLKRKPNKVVMIDDKPANITAAQALGMYGIVFSDVAQLRAELEPLLSA